MWSVFIFNCAYFAGRGEHTRRHGGGVCWSFWCSWADQPTHQQTSNKHRWLWVLVDFAKRLYLLLIIIVFFFFFFNTHKNTTLSFPLFLFPFTLFPFPISPPRVRVCWGVDPKIEIIVGKNSEFHHPRDSVFFALGAFCVVPRKKFSDFKQKTCAAC